MEWITLCEEHNANGGLENGWGCSRVIEFNRPCIVQSAATFNLLEEPGMTKVTQNTIFVVIECHITIDLLKGFDALPVLHSVIIVVDCFKAFT